MSIWRKNDLLDEPSTSAAEFSLAELYRKRGEMASARPLYEHLVALWSETVPEDDSQLAMALNGLSAVYREDRRIGERGAAVSARPCHTRGCFGPGTCVNCSEPA